ncbi:glycosyltransferase family 2 protein [Nesterenkonia aerolata]|uniref:Glycosyltransferase family 2 protein n=1 Tax=Nesterenkonia aerolata TaxID=3074079 RepID=A0ABU2DPX6_9MICC|nr:glycosyltransferase family 2 protein [Nesterenkonia sp. LY-0111]MDR8018560.1 glycosyltransferase family 2 protein [Nesterenkonia sp. LY-0111]
MSRSEIPVQMPATEDPRAHEAAAATARAHEAAAHLLETKTHRRQHWETLAAAHRDRAAHLRSVGSPEAPHAAVSAPQEVAALQRTAATLPPGEMGISRPRLDLRIGIICDRFLFDTFTGLAELVPLTPQNWQDHLDDVDLLLVAATWRGHDGHSWDTTADDAASRRQLLIETLIPAYRQAGIPTVYYGKEDPPDYRKFLAVARACEHILTTAVEAVDWYHRDCPEAHSVGVLPFAVNPLLHSPLGSRPAATQAVLFAGSWMGKKYPLRAEYARWILDGTLAARRSPVIIDRYYEAEHPSPNQLVPYDYWGYRAPAVDHTALMGLQRVVDVAVNLNSVPDSQTMFANRALELQASGTAVLSTYNQGINSYYPQVHIANSAENVAAMLQYLDDGAEGLEMLRRIQSDGIRQVFRQNHGVDLLAHLAEVAGVPVELPQERVLAVTAEITEELAADIAAQTHEQTTLVTWDQLVSAGAPEAEILMPVTPERRYGADYTADHVAAFRLQSSPISVKLDGDAASTDSLALRHRQGLEGLDLSLTAFWKPSTLSTSRPSAEGLHAEAVGRRVFLGDHLNHTPIQPEPGPPRVHTEPNHAAEAARQTAQRLGLEVSVVVPVFNNGGHLRHKAFASLRRSPGFSRMQVLLIDDGSTDGITASILEELAARYPNVTAFRHPVGGSGSASRPRNLGLEIAATEFVTYLDPDDEQYGDAYTTMADLLRGEPEAQFALGTQYTWSDRRRHLDVHSWLTPASTADGRLLRPDRNTLAAASFRPASIEGMVARTDWLRSLGLVQPEGATGQDTLFFQQLLDRTEAYLPVAEPAYVYYGAVDTSIVNVVSPRYFRKYLIVEAARADWLRAEGLLEAYRDTRLEHFLVTWYLPQLALVPDAQCSEAEAVLHEIIGLYTDEERTMRWRTPEALRFFGRRALPDPRRMRPTLGRWRRRLRAEAAERGESFRRTGPGRLAGGVYRRTLKPRDPEAAAEQAQMRADEKMILSPTSAVSEADRWERRLTP